MSDTQPPPESGRARPLFRPEVLEHRARGRAPGRVLAIGRGTTRGFQLLLFSVTVVVVASFFITADEATAGEAVVVGEGKAMLVLPIGSQPRLRAGLPVRVRLAGGGPAASGRLAGPAQPVAGRELGELLGPRATADHASVVALVEVNLRSAPAVPAGTRGEGEVRLARRRLATILIPGLERVIGSDSG